MKGLNLRPWVAAIAVLGCFATGATEAHAQQSIRHVYTNKTNIKVFIKDVERQSNDFRTIFEKRYNEMFISNYRRTDTVRNAVQELDEALEMAHRKAKNNKPQYARAEVKRVMEKANRLDAMFSLQDQVLDTMRQDWKSLKDSINELARVYELDPID